MTVLFKNRQLCVSVLYIPSRIMCKHIFDQIRIKSQIIAVEDSEKQEQEMRDIVWRRAWLRSVEKQKEWKSIMSEGRYKYLVLFLRWRDGLMRYATASGSDPLTLLTPLDSDKRNSSNRSYAKNKSKWTTQKGESQAGNLIFKE